MLTFDNGIMGVGECVGIGCYTACTLSKNNNSIGVTSKIGDICIYPLNSGVNVKQAKVFGVCTAGELRNIRLTEDVYPVVDCDDSEVVVVAHKVLAIVGWYVALIISKFMTYYL
jgi:hypothetical protein